MAFTSDAHVFELADMTELSCSSCQFSKNSDGIYIDEIGFDPYIEFAFEATSGRSGNSFAELSSEHTPDLERELRLDTPLEFVELDIRVEALNLNPITWIFAVWNQSILHSACSLVED